MIDPTVTSDRSSIYAILCMLYPFVLWHHILYVFTFRKKCLEQNSLFHLCFVGAAPYEGKGTTFGFSVAEKNGLITTAWTGKYVGRVTVH